MYFDKKINFFHLNVNSQKELFETLANELVKNDIVKESYLEGISEREAEYPTGILFENTGFAIPHTDSKHVKQSQICFASLAKPVEFKDMMDKSKTVSVELVFMLAMSQPHEQVETLQNLMTLFQDKVAVEKIKECNGDEEFSEILQNANIY